MPEAAKDEMYLEMYEKRQAFLQCGQQSAAPLFVSKSIQPTYNPKARYLPILPKYPFHKCLNISGL
jgi:hypothetical protein